VPSQSTCIGHWLWAHIVYGSECWGQVCRKCGLLGVLQSQTEDSALFNVQERGKYGQDEAAICLQAFVPGIAVLRCFVGVVVQCL